MLVTSCLLSLKNVPKKLVYAKHLGAQPWSIVGMILQEVCVCNDVFWFIRTNSLDLGLLELVGPLIESDFIKYPQVDFNTALSYRFYFSICRRFSRIYSSI